MINVTIDGLAHGEILNEWSEGTASLMVERVTFAGIDGAMLVYTNPLVHQVGYSGLTAYLNALAVVAEHADSLGFLILTSPCDPVHVGGDIRESLTHLDETLVKRTKLEAVGASNAEIWDLYRWGDARLGKGMELYKAVRGLASRMTVVAACGGGQHFGGSAEIVLMADFIVADSRSSMCFSEVEIGLIPGWGGIGRAVTKAGFNAAKAMTYGAKVVSAHQLAELGIVDRVVHIEWPLPRMGRTGNKEADITAYLADLATNEIECAPRLLAEALALAVEPPALRDTTADSKVIALDRGAIERRADPETYHGMYGVPLNEVRNRIEQVGKPLAPQSVKALDRLFALFENEPQWDEEAFVIAERNADAALYRDPRFRTGIVATLEQKVADFSASFLLP